MDEQHQLPSAVVEARRLREDAAEIRRGLGDVVQSLLEQRAVLRRVVRTAYEVLQGSAESDPPPSRW